MEFADFVTNSALDALVRINDVEFLGAASNGLNRTFLGAGGASLTQRRINFWLRKRLALAGGTAFVFDVGLVFGAEVSEG